MTATEDDKLIEAYLEPDRAGPESAMLSEWLDHAMLSTVFRHGGPAAEIVRQKIKGLIAEMARHSRQNVPYVVALGDRELFRAVMDALKAIGADKTLKPSERLAAFELYVSNLG